MSDVRSKHDKPDGQTFEHGGGTFKIVWVDVNNGCKGCAGKNDYGVCRAVGLCTGYSRSDGRDVIAVETSDHV